MGGGTYSRRTPALIALGGTLPQQPADAPPGLVEMRRIPAGCLLIRTSVFQKLKAPYFRFRVCEEAGEIIGEDYDSSDRVRALGYRIWSAPIPSTKPAHPAQPPFPI